MVDFIGEIKKIEKEIENAAKDVASHVVDELQAAKKRLETDMERMLLKTEVSFKVSEMIHEQQYMIRKNQDLFHDVCKDLADKSEALNKSFESRTGSNIQKELNEHLSKIRNQFTSTYYEFYNSCGKK
ncbi:MULTISPECIES: hypothetical protein [unclassified Bacillus (in: firmicutes)]|uniref:hypothetical protein n=1 Tax=unclassified Bacillus (in: firmicutes) TaxID=185979 RepID=UPI0008E16B05|nr:MULTISPECIES: hypothetical protein [unclassified Bacillus (in: firmicutes)]SFJ31203.1 hypothetical protein SAMN04488574_11025 [Bacillus sp. 71mf]SFT02224.1 hypothetical protein SAMN04488145_107111 [Bacillus sp. 103mf]